MLGCVPAASQAPPNVTLLTSFVSIMSICHSFAQPKVMNVSVLSMNCGCQYECRALGVPSFIYAVGALLAFAQTAVAGAGLTTVCHCGASSSSRNARTSLPAHAPAPPPPKINIWLPFDFNVP